MPEILLSPKHIYNVFFFLKGKVSSPLRTYKCLWLLMYNLCKYYIIVTAQPEFEEIQA